MWDGYRILSKRCTSHIESHRSSLEDIIMIEIGFCVGFSVEFHTLDVDIF